MARSPQRHGVFVSYSHKDAKWLDRLKVHLEPSVSRGDLNLWDDSKIDPGELWLASIKEAIDGAAAAILLISADFLASRFIATQELPRLLDRAEKGGARILSIVVGHCNLDAHPRIARYQALNEPSRPLSGMPRPKAERTLDSAAKHVARLLGRPTDTTTPGAIEECDDQLFEEMKAAAVTLAVLDALARPDCGSPAYTIGDLMRVLNIKPRQLCHQAAERLFEAGWVDKRREDKINTRFCASAKGVRQLQRLVAAAPDGPLGRGR